MIEKIEHLKKILRSVYGNMLSDVHTQMLHRFSREYHLQKVTISAPFFFSFFSFCITSNFSPSSYLRKIHKLHRNLFRKRHSM